MKKQISKKWKRKTSKPPRTKRYCMACEKITEFTYNQRRLHSECIECGGTWARRPNEKDKDK